MNKEKILVDGIFSYDIPDTAPDFVLGKTAYKVEKFIEFLQNNKKYAVNGFLTVQTLRSKTGKRYAVLDTYEYEKKQSQGDGQGYENFHNAMTERFHGADDRPAENRPAQSNFEPSADNADEDLASQIHF